jgi:hypothetical protein
MFEPLFARLSDRYHLVAPPITFLLITFALTMTLALG